MPDAMLGDIHIDPKLAIYLDRLACGICVMDTDFRLLVANRPFFEIMGYPLEFNVQGVSLERLVEFDCARGLYGDASPKALFEHLCGEARRVPSSTVELILPEGRAVEFRRRTAEDGSFVCMVENVTRRRYTADLLESEGAIIRHLSDAVAICNFEHRVLEHNPAFARMFGFDGSSARNTRMPPAGFEATPAADEILAGIDEGIATHGRHIFEVGIVRCNGTRISTRAIVLPRRDGAGDLVGYISIYRDITNEVRDQRRLERQDRVIAQLSEAVFVLDAEGRVVDCNRAAERTYGISAGEFRGNRLCALLRPVEDRSGPGEEVLERLLAGARWTGETHMRARSGRRVVADVNIQPYYDEAGKVAGIISVHRDVTERHAANERLRRQALIIEHMREAAVVTDPEGRIEEMNSSAARIFGRGPRNEISEAFKRQLAEIARSTREDGHFEGGYALEVEDACTDEGGPVYCDSVAVAVRDKDGEIAHIVSVHRDVTDRVLRERDQARHEERRKHRKRLEALGQLAGGIAHDFNNVLTPILGYAHLANDGLPPDHPARADLARVIKGMEQARDLVRQILTFGSHMEPPQHPVILDRTIAEALDLVANSLPAGIRLERDLRCAEIAIRGNPTLLRQLALNLCANAIQAMPEGGRLRVATDCGGDWKTLRREQGLSGERHVRLILEDEGCGIPEEHLEQIFDPFFTSKPSGTGLGLSVVHGVVRAHGGAIRVDSKPGRGTRFEIYFPALEKEQVLPAPRDSEKMRSGGESILLVDDDADVLDMLRRMLESRGYEVRTVQTGEEAVALLDSGASSFDAVVTDITMPGLNGACLCRIVREHWPDLPVIAMSGRVDREIVREYRSWGARFLLHKPVLPRDFEDALTKVLEG